MHIVTLSASNIRHARAASTSGKVCQCIGQILRETCSPEICLDILALVEHELRPCVGCGACYKTGACSHDPVFNTLYARMVQADALFIVAAHYAPIPAKLCMLLEKVEQLAFLPRFQDENRRSPLYHRPVGIIGHCGSTEEWLGHGYKGQILDTITNALGWPVEMRVIGAGPDWPNGVLFPVHSVRHDPSSIFPVQEYDWEDIRRRITPLVQNVYRAALAG